MSINFAELEKLAKRVERYPEQYRQEFWGYGAGSKVVKEQKPMCGTAGCLAYNVVSSHGYRLALLDTEGETYKCSKGKKIFDIKETAQNILGLNNDQQDELFGGGRARWSRRAYHAYDVATTPTERAAAAVMQVKDFIAKYRAIEAYGKALNAAIIRYAE